MIRTMVTRAGGAAAMTLTLAALSGCALMPAGADAERALVEKAGAAGGTGAYEVKVEDRALPELSGPVTWRETLHRGLLANGELESAYFQWKAAVERIRGASGYPNTNVALGFSGVFSSDRMKAFDRTTASAGFDGMENLSFPTKVMRAGKIALDEARAAGERFRGVKFDVQRRVLSAWAQYTLALDVEAIEGERLALARIVRDSARARVEAGESQAALLKAEMEMRTAEDGRQRARAEVRSLRAVLNGLLAREGGAALNVSASGSGAREIPPDDMLLAAAVDRNPELAALAREVEGRGDALALARMQWIPDINPMASFTGSVAQVLGATLILPTTIVEIQAGIDESRAMLQALEASVRQASHDKAAAFVGVLVLLRDAERQESLFQTLIVPIARRIGVATREAYAAGGGMGEGGGVTIAQVIDAERLEISARLTVAEARSMREIRLAELESLMGVDVETLLDDGAKRATRLGMAKEVEGGK